MIENGLKIELQFEIPYTEDIEKKSVVYKCNIINKEFQGIFKLKLKHFFPFEFGPRYLSLMTDETTEGSSSESI